MTFKFVTFCEYVEFGGGKNQFALFRHVKVVNIPAASFRPVDRSGSREERTKKAEPELNTDWNHLKSCKVGPAHKKEPKFVFDTIAPS